MLSSNYQAPFFNFAPHSLHLLVWAELPMKIHVTNTITDFLQSGLYPNSISVFSSKNFLYSLKFQPSSQNRKWLQLIALRLFKCVNRGKYSYSNSIVLSIVNAIYTSYSKTAEINCKYFMFWLIHVSHLHEGWMWTSSGFAF